MINLTRPEMESLLRNYRAERESIERMASLLAEDLNMLFAPSGADFSRPTVQTQYSQAAQVEAMLRKSQQATTTQHKVLTEIKARTAVLDSLLQCVWSLPGHLRNVVLQVVVGGVSQEAYAEAQGISPRNVVRLKAQALESVYSRLTRRKVDTWNADAPEAPE